MRLQLFVCVETDYKEGVRRQVNKQWRYGESKQVRKQGRIW